MPYRKRTLRAMTPEARRYARLIGEMENLTKRMKNLLPRIQDIELAARAEEKRERFERDHQNDDAVTEELFTEEIAPPGQAQEG